MTIPSGSTLVVALSLVSSVGVHGPTVVAAQLDEPRQQTLRGSVTDPSDHPVVGATIELTNRTSPDQTRTAKTDDQGRWSVPRIETGIWDLRIEADGLLPSSGFVAVSDRPIDPVWVELRNLDEATPAFAEVSAQTSVTRWLQHGNDLLDQGQTAAARGEYQRALRYVRGEQRAEVLRAVARTHFLEQDVASTIDVLEQALRAAPESTETRTLYRAVREQLGQQAEAESFLADLETIEDPPAPSPTPRPSRQPPAPEPVPAVAHRTGVQTVSFDQRSPLSGIEEIAGRYQVRAEDLRERDPKALAWAPEEASFDLVVPADYDQDHAYGLLVWISPIARGGLRTDEAMESLLADRRLLWIGANDSGNPRPAWDRVGLALDAVHGARTLYTIDPERIYVAGYSGGGRVSSHMAFLFPDVFSGGIFWFGVDHWKPVPVPYQPGASWPPGFDAPPAASLKALRRDGRFALVTGSRDFNRAETKMIARLLREDGFRGITYLEIPGADHYHGLDAEWLDRSLDAIESAP